MCKCGERDSEHFLGNGRYMEKKVKKKRFNEEKQKQFRDTLNGIKVGDRIPIARLGLENAWRFSVPVQERLLGTWVERYGWMIG